MKDNRIKRFLALVLAASMILSDVSMAVYAAEEEELSVYCGLEEHTHGDICFDSAGIMVCSETEHTHNEECYVNPENKETEAVGEREGTEETQATEETETEELPLIERLMSAETLEALFNLIFSETEGLAALTLDEVSAVNAYTQSIYDALDTPTEAEQGYYTQIMDTLSQLLRADEETEATEETEVPSETAEAPSETTEAPSETTEAPSETTEAPGETTEAPSETTETPKKTEATETTEATEETESTEEAESEDETADIPLMDRLMTTQTLQELYDLVMAESEGMEALSLGEISAVKTQTQTLYSVIVNPTEDEQNFYAQIMNLLNTRLGDQQPDFADTTAPIDVSGEQPGGEITVDTHWVLQGDVTLKQQLELKQNVDFTIDLNGYVLYVQDGQWFALLDNYTNSSLTILDSNPTKAHYGVMDTNNKWTYYEVKPDDYATEVLGGIITGKGNTSHWGGAICMGYNVTLNMKGGTIANFTAEQGGAIRNSGIVNMTGGKLYNNTSLGNGGAIHNSGYIYLSGGTISHNTANDLGGGIYTDNYLQVGCNLESNTANNGGAVYVAGGEMLMTGGTISQNIANNVGGGIYNTATLKIQGGTISYNDAKPRSGNGSTGGGGGIYSSNTFTMSNGLIQNNTAYNGGGVTISGGTFSMTGGSIDHNTANADGGGIYQHNSDTVKVTISGGGVYNNTGAWGGGVHIASGTFELSNEGSISSNTATTNGGGISSKNSKVHLTGGYIHWNTANSYGGGIMMENGTLTMAGGSIKENKATGSNGGGILIRGGKFTMTSGSIESNTANENGGGIMVESGANEFTMEGGNIDRNTARNGGGIAHQIAITISGGSISSNTASYGGGIYSMNTVNIGINTAQVESITTETEGVTTKTEGSIIVISANTAYNEGGGIFIENNGSLVMSGGTISQNTAKSANSNTANGTGGGIYVKSSTSAQITGGTIDSNTAGNGGGIYNAGVLTINNGTISNNTANSGGGGIYNTSTASIENSNISHNHSPYGYGGGIRNHGTFTMNSGTISGNTAGTTNSNDGIDGKPVYSSHWGGGIYTSGTFTMEDGTITENSAASGGGIGVWGGSFNMKGGTISYNNAYGTGGPGNGGAAYVNSAAFNFYAGTIEHNWARRYGGAINLNEGGKLFLHGTIGECIIQYNSANNGGGISQEQGLCEMAISHENIKIIHNTARDDNREERDDLKADGCGGGLFVEKGTLTFSAGTISNNTAVAGGGIALRVQRIAGDITVNVTGGTLSGNTATTTGGGIDISADFDDHDSETFNKVEVNLKDGKLDRNISQGTGGGINIWVNEANSSAEMYIGKEGNTEGPELIDNEAATNGGAIRIRSGNVHLHSGRISGNTAGQYGGGITVNGGNFTMSGGTIGGTAEDSANTAGNGGGGIALRIVESASDITVTMTGGTISGNKAQQTGAGIDIYADFDDGDSETTNMVRVDLINGKFEKNTSMGTGGGIDIWVNEENSFAEMHIGEEDKTEGPEFIGNEAATNGGAIRMRSGNIFLHGGTITRNTAKSNGGAISVNGGDFTMYNGVVSQNTVTEGYGGGIALSNGTIVISNGSVINNAAKVHGGGIVVSNGEIIITGGAVSNNVAETGNGGGVYVTSVGGGDVAVKIFSGEVANNRAPNGSGGGVAVNGGLVENGATKIFVQTGLNALHESTGDKALNNIPHNREGIQVPSGSEEFIHKTCPVITNNSSLKSGGGIYITGGSETKLNIYCLTEAENSTVEDKDHNDVLSKFMMVEGGKVIISSCHTGEDGVIDPNTSNYGNTSVLSSIHVYAGELYLYGNMDNPAFKEALTVDYRNETDIFVDYRQSNSVIKLTYNENFTDANGKPESTLKTFDIQNGATVTIAELLFNHPGYTIKAWNTKSDGTGIKFNVGDQYVFVKTEADKNKYELKVGQQYWVGDLNLFADWEVNSFLVVYHHNIPEGQPYSGSMDGEHIFTYDQDDNLLANQFVYTGHVFQHWTYTKDDGTPATLTDKQEVRNLTNVRGGTVHLYAVWAECDHPEKEIQYSADGPVLTKHCKQCGQSATVTIQANNAVYDGNKHMYTIVHSDAAFLAPEVTCSAVKFNSTEAPANLYVDAGQYTVTTNESGSDVQASLTYTIEKAEQKAPMSLPTYDTPKGDDHTVKIHQATGEMYAPESGALIQYTVRYTKDGTVYDLDWKSDADGGDVTFDLKESLITYSVYSRYPETDNYKESPKRVAMSSFFFNGFITVLITPTNGVTYTSEPKADSLDITAILEDGYYLEDGNFYVTIKEGNDSKYISVNGADSGKIAATSENTFIIKALGTPEDNVEIHLELGYATKAITVTSKIEPNQVFGTVSGSEITISRDSAYTVYFEVNGFDDAVYRAPQLAFDQSIPVGTRFILVDKSNNSYWYHTVNQSQISYPLKNFKRMGAETSDPFIPVGTDWKLQVIVDFSQVATENNKLPSELRTWLELLKEYNAPANAPDLSSASVNPGVYVKLLNTSFTLEKAVDSQQRLTYSFNSETANVSRWDHRELALILRPTTAIPADAFISAEQNGVTVDYRPVQIPKGDGTETAFLIPLNGFSGEVFLSMESGTAKAGNYYISAQLVAAASIAENAPVNGTAVVDSVVEVVFSVSDVPLSIKVKETNDCHLFAPGSAMNLNIQVQPTALPSGYRLIVALEQKGKNDTDYSFYGVYYEPTNTGTNYTLSAHAPANPGNYRIRFYIETANGTNMLETAYYLIVQ